MVLYDCLHQLCVVVKVPGANVRSYIVMNLHTIECLKKTTYFSHTWATYVVENLHKYFQSFFQGGVRAFAPLGFGLPPLGYAENSILHVNQFKPL